MKQNPYKIIGKILSEVDHSDKPGYLKSAASSAGIGLAGAGAAHLAGTALGGGMPTIATKPGIKNAIARGVQSVGKKIRPGMAGAGALAAGGAALGLGAAALKRARQKRQELS
jgi:hypothetical protein